MRLIDADQVYDLHSNYPAFARSCADLEDLRDILDEASTVDAALVVHGKWINTPPYYALNGEYNKVQECSVCHAFFVSSGVTPYSNHPYCCECGAKMGLEEM